MIRRDRHPILDLRRLLRLGALNCPRATRREMLMARLPELFTRLHEVGSNGVQAPQLMTGLGIPTQPAFSGLIQEKYKAWHKTRKVGALAATAYQLMTNTLPSPVH